MAGATIRTNTVERLLTDLETQADQCDKLGARWVEEFGSEDRNALSEMVKAEEIRRVVQYLRKNLGITK